MRNGPRTMGSHLAELRLAIDEARRLADGYLLEVSVADARNVFAAWDSVYAALHEIDRREAETCPWCTAEREWMARTPSAGRPVGWGHFGDCPIGGGRR